MLFLAAELDLVEELNIFLISINILIFSFSHSKKLLKKVRLNFLLTILISIVIQTFTLLVLGDVFHDISLLDFKISLISFLIFIKLSITVIYYKKKLETYNMKFYKKTKIKISNKIWIKFNLSSHNLFSNQISPDKK